MDLKFGIEKVIMPIALVIRVKYYGNKKQGYFNYIDGGSPPFSATREEPTIKYR